MFPTGVAGDVEAVETTCAVTERNAELLGPEVGVGDLEHELERDAPNASGSTFLLPTSDDDRNRTGERLEAGRRIGCWGSPVRPRTREPSPWSAPLQTSSGDPHPDVGSLPAGTSADRRRPAAAVPDNCDRCRIAGYSAGGVGAR